MRVVLADDHELVRCGIAALLNTLPGVVVVGEARDGHELLRVLGTVEADLVITDLQMPGMDGFTAIRHIRQTQPQLPVLVLSMQDSAEMLKRAIGNGAAGYLRKNASELELQMALRSVLGSGRYLSAGLASRLLEPTEPAPEQELTQRQIEIVVLMAQGRSTREIAQTLAVSSKTVDTHRVRIMDRLGLRDIAGITRYALRKGLVSP